MSTFPDRQSFPNEFHQQEFQFWHNAESVYQVFGNDMAPVQPQIMGQRRKRNQTEAFKKCGNCIKDRQRCEPSLSSSACQRCVRLGYDCSPDFMGEPTGKRRKLSSLKCEQCRSKKQKCEPEGRQWPGQRCRLCIMHDLPCSEPQLATGRRKRTVESDRNTPEINRNPMESDVATFEPIMELNSEPGMGLSSIALIDGAQPSAATAPPPSPGYRRTAAPTEMTSLHGGFSAMQASPPSGRTGSGRNDLPRGFDDVKRYLEERAECPEWVTGECIKRLSTFKQRLRSTRFSETNSLLGAIDISEMVALGLESRRLYSQAEELYRSMISVCQNLIRSEGTSTFQRTFVEKLWKLVTRLVSILEEKHRVEAAIEVLEDFTTRLIILPDDCPGGLYRKEVVFHLLRLYPQLATLCEEPYSTIPGFSLHRALELQWPALVAAALDDIPKDSLSLKYRNAGGTALHVIAKMEHRGPEAPFLSAAEKLLDLGADLEATDDDGKTPLFLAAELGQAGMVQLFLGRGANAVAPARIKPGPSISNHQDLRHQPPSPLHAAIFNSHEQIALHLLSHIPDLGDLEHSAAALVYACEKGLYGVVCHLLDKGLDINACHMVKREFNERTLLLDTPLTLATFGGHKKVMQHLLARGTSLEAKKGCNAVWVAIETERGDFLALLLEHSLKLLDNYNRGCCEPRSNHPNESPLQQSCRRGWHLGIQMLINKGANPNKGAHYDGGKPPLQAACEGGHESIVEILLRAGADVNAPPEWQHGRTALQAACQGGHESIVEILLRAGANVNAPSATSGGRTVLQAACEGGHESIVEILLRAGANVNASPAEYHGRTALQAACKGGHESIAEILLRAGADVNAPPARFDGRTALQAACKGGHESIVEILLRAGANVNAPRARSGGRTALQAACKSGYESIVEILLRAGANVNAPPATIDGRTALRAACGGGHKSIVEILLRAGANVNASPAEYHGRTALQAACKDGHESIVEILLRAGADVDASPAEYPGRTALQAACQGGHESIVEALLRAGANVNASPAWQHGRTALQAACEGGHESIVEILLRAGANVNAPGGAIGGRTALRCGRGHPKTNITKLLLDAGAIC